MRRPALKVSHCYVRITYEVADFFQRHVGIFWVVFDLDVQRLDLGGENGGDFIPQSHVGLDLRVVVHGGIAGVSFLTDVQEKREDFVGIVGEMLQLLITIDSCCVFVFHVRYFLTLGVKRIFSVLRKGYSAENLS